jgi:hypothetical protein
MKNDMGIDVDLFNELEKYFLGRFIVDPLEQELFNLIVAFERNGDWFLTTTAFVEQLLEFFTARIGVDFDGVRGFPEANIESWMVYYLRNALKFDKTWGIKTEDITRDEDESD